MRAQVTDPLKRKIERVEFFVHDTIEKVNVLTENYAEDNEELRAAVQNLTEQVERAR